MAIYKLLQTNKLLIIQRRQHALGHVYLELLMTARDVNPKPLFLISSGWIPVRIGRCQYSALHSRTADYSLSLDIVEGIRFRPAWE